MQVLSAKLTTGLPEQLGRARLVQRRVACQVTDIGLLAGAKPYLRRRFLYDCARKTACPDTCLKNVASLSAALIIGVLFSHEVVGGQQRMVTVNRVSL
jgi:hypothetical protein